MFKNLFQSTWKNKSKYASNPADIFKSPRKFYEKLYTKKITPKAASNEFLTEVRNRKTVSNEQFKFVRRKCL